jgi:hypothetical protein
VVLPLSLFVQHLSFPIRSRPINSWKNIDAWLPIEIGN